MKKLMIAAAIVCTAALSQAATFTWGASGVTGCGVDTLYSGSATIHLALSTAPTVEVASFGGSMSGGAINTVIGNDTIQAGKMYMAWYTMEDAAGNTFMSGRTGAMANATQSPALNFMSGGSWTAVPEPTSGLLLLLGVAGLALRRRRA